MTSKFFKRSKAAASNPTRSKVLPSLSKKQLGDLVPKRGNKFAPKIGSALLKAAGWRTVGEIPNIPQAVVLALPHTSNVDGIYAIPSLFALDLKISIMGKHTLFKVPVFAQLLKWIGVIPIDRGNKGSVLQASIDKFKTEKKKKVLVSFGCHGIKTLSESNGISFQEAAITKEAIKLIKDGLDKQFFIDRNLEIPSNADKRRINIVNILMKELNND